MNHCAKPCGFANRDFLAHGSSGLEWKISPVFSTVPVSRTPLEKRNGSSALIEIE